MLSFKSLLFVVLVVSMATSCSLFRKGDRRAVVMPEIKVSAENNPMDQYRATATKAWELVNTRIDIGFNIPDRTADATADLMLHPYFYATDSVVLDAKSMRIQSVTLGDGRTLSYYYDTLQLHIRLPEVFQKEDTLQLKIIYTALPYAFSAGGDEAIREDRGLYFINADRAEPYKPVQIWTQGETEANSHWFPTFDRSNFRSAFEITMHVPDSFRSLSNGLLVRSVKDGMGLRADTWKQALPIPPYLVMMAIGDFHVVKEQWQGKEVSYYVPQAYAPYAKAIFNHTPEMMEYYSTLLGIPFPWDKYSQVIGYDYVSGAMENVSASLFGAFNLKDNRQLADDNNDYIVAHELFHQWFGDYVTAESWSHLTLNESFADYGEHLWSAFKYGEDARQQVWQQALDKYLAQSTWSDPSLVRFYYLDAGSMFDRVSYSKGALILHYLRQLMGDKAFFEVLHTYLSNNSLHSAEAVQLRLAAEQITGADWNWFFNQWYYRGGHPVLEITYDYDDSLRQLKVNISQVQNDSIGVFRLPVQARLIGSGGVDQKVNWDIHSRQEQFVYDYPGKERPVVIPDAGHWIPGVIREEKDVADWVIQYQLSGDYISKKNAIVALAKVKNNDRAWAVIEEALKDKDPLLRNLALELLEKSGRKKIDKQWENAVGGMAQNDKNNKVRAAALGILGDRKNEGFTTVYEQSVGDSSYLIAAAGLYALNKVNHKRAVSYIRALDLAAMLPSALLFTVADVLGQEGDADDYPFYEKALLCSFESNRAGFIPGVQEYLVTVKNDSVYRKGVHLLQLLALRDPSADRGLYIGAALLNIKNHAAHAAKIASDKSEIEFWKTRKDLASDAWQVYKKSVGKARLKTEIAKLEQEQ